MIISIEGFKGVGKTTLISELKKIYPDFCYITSKERNDYLKKNLIMNVSDSENQFYIMQKTLIKFIDDIWKRHSRDKIIIMDRGPEDLEFYTRYYPYAFGFNWDYEKKLSEELEILRNIRSDRILFLGASDEVIFNRKNNDKKSRAKSAKDEFLSSKLMKEYFLKLAYTTLINTDNLSVGEVVDCAKYWMDNQCLDINIH